MSWLRSTAEEIARRSVVTDEPFAVAPALLGHPLASIRRRGLAFALDTVAALALGILVMLGATLAVIAVQAPSAYAVGKNLSLGHTNDDALTLQAQFELYELIHRRRPDLLPGEVAETVENGDAAALDRVLERAGIGVNYDAGNSTPSYFDAGAGIVRVHNDIVFGIFGSFFSFLAVFIGYFAAAAAIGNGSTPAKRLLRLRARRLDGERMGWTAAFERAGGYASSASTLGLGFLAAVRDPNRQALHDRIAGTVVVIERTSRLARLRARLRRATPGDGAD